MRPSALFGAGWTVAALVCALAAPLAAQEADEAADSGDTVAPVAAAPDDAQPPAETPLTPEETAMLGNALLFDSATMADGRPQRSLRLPGPHEPGKFAISRTDKPDGSSTLVVRPPLADEWVARIGADLKLATPPDGGRPGRPFARNAPGEDSGAAWASLGLSDLASLDARLDPANEQGKLATTFKHSIPLGGKFSVTLQDSYSVTEIFGPPAPAPSDLPLMAAPVASTTPTPQIWGSQKVVKFDILSTGTSFGAGLVTASNDPVTHNTLSADQKLYGPLHLTTALIDVGQPSSSTSINARLKLNW